jgi:low temperature requirement protein LtrA
VGLVQFAFLFVPVWWAWVGTTFYADRFDYDDNAHRILTAVQMFGVAVVAVSIHRGLPAGSAGFAFSYTLVRAVLVVQYVRAAWHYPASKELALRYARGFGVAAVIWLASGVVPVPGRYVLWVVAVVIDFGTPLSSIHLHAKYPLDESHLPERFGLFTLIVLGESVLAVVNGLASQRWELSSAATGAFGFAVAFSLWWIYFDNIDHTVIRRTRVAGQVWVYAHLPFVMGVTAAGVGVRLAAAHPPSSALPVFDRWILASALALCLVTMAVFDITTVSSFPSMAEAPGRPRLVAAVLVVAIAAAGTRLRPLWVAALFGAVCASQVLVDLWTDRHPSRRRRPRPTAPG